MASPVRLAYSSDDEDASVPYSEVRIYQRRRPSEDKKPTPAPAMESVMTDPITRDELTAKLETIEAKADARFKEIMGEIKTSNATIAGKVDLAASKSAGKWTVWGAAGSIIVAMVATIIVLLQVMQTGYDTGRSAEKDLNEAATRVAAQRQSVEAANARP